MGIELGKVGIWTAYFSYQPASAVREAAAELDELGYGSIWIGEAVYREPFVTSGLLLASTSRAVVGTGIASIWARDPFTMTAAQLSLAEAYPDRFLLGMGVSHPHLTEDLRGRRYERPLSAMRDYLDAMDKARPQYRAVLPADQPPRVIAALGPKMLALAAERADGAHTYFVPPEHTEKARTEMGPEAWLIPEQAVAIEPDPHRAREIARQHTTRYLGLPNYTNNLRRLGFTDEDFEHDGSDRLVDAIVAWGDAETVAKRIREHHDAGADHVSVQVLSDDRRQLPMRQWRELASVLLPSARQSEW